jgi:predicted RNase H-like HicB family nuclease
MSTVYYPAVFHAAEDVGGYWIEFPDLPGCFSQGKNEIEAMEMAKDALSLWLDTDGDLSEREFKDPSTCAEIQKQYPGELIMLIEGDPDYYARKYHTKAVKKTLSIPQWLNDKAIKANINFSQVLQEALINKLGL